MRIALLTLSTECVSSVRGSILHVPNGIHVVMQNPHDEDAVFAGRPVEDQVTFVWKSAVSWPDIVGGSAHFGMVSEELQAVCQRVEVIFRLQQAKLGQGLLQDVFDILGRRIGKLIHCARAVL